MTIENIRPDILRSRKSTEPRSSEDVRPTEPVSESSPSRRDDRVEISDAGRALAERAEEARPQESGPERLSAIRERVDDGFYDRSEVIEAVARRVLTSGDL